jgi:hypothetical protein
MERSSSARAATIYPCSDGLMKIGVGDLPSSQHLSGKLGSLAAHLFCILVVLFDCGFVRGHFVTYFCVFSISFVVIEHSWTCEVLSRGRKQVMGTVSPSHYSNKSRYS